MAKAQEEKKTQEVTSAEQKESRSHEQGKQQTQALQPRRSEGSMVPRRRGSHPTPHDGMGSLSRLRDEFDRLFDQFSRGWLGMPMDRGESAWGLDMREDDHAVTVRAEAPGFEPSDFDIQVRSGQLVLRATHKDEKKDGESHEWQQHEFYQAVSLPTEVETDKVKASYRQGVLTVTIPRSESSKAKHIAVEG